MNNNNERLDNIRKTTIEFIEEADLSIPENKEKIKDIFLTMYNILSETNNEMLEQEKRISKTSKRLEDIEKNIKEIKEN